jgi:hypothetical protein
MDVTPLFLDFHGYTAHHRRYDQQRRAWRPDSATEYAGDPL